MSEPTHPPLRHRTTDSASARRRRASEGLRDQQVSAGHKGAHRGGTPERSRDSRRAHRPLHRSMDRPRDGRSLRTRARVLQHRRSRSERRCRVHGLGREHPRPAPGGVRAGCHERSRRQPQEQGMTSAEYRRWHREHDRRRAPNAELVASKARREEAARASRAAREAEAFAIKHQLPPERIYQRQPEVTLAAGFGGLRPRPRPRGRSAASAASGSDPCQPRLSRATCGSLPLFTHRAPWLPWGRRTRGRDGVAVFPWHPVTPDCSYRLRRFLISSSAPFSGCGRWQIAGELGGFLAAAARTTRKRAASTRRESPPRDAAEERGRECTVPPGSNDDEICTDRVGMAHDLVDRITAQERGCRTHALALGDCVRVFEHLLVPLGWLVGHMSHQAEAVHRHVVGLLARRRR